MEWYHPGSSHGWGSQPQSQSFLNVVPPPPLPTQGDSMPSAEHGSAVEQPIGLNGSQPLYHNFFNVMNHNWSSAPAPASYPHGGFWNYPQPQLSQNIVAPPYATTHATWGAPNPPGSPPLVEPPSSSWATSYPPPGPSNSSWIAASSAPNYSSWDNNNNNNSSETETQTFTSERPRQASPPPLPRSAPRGMKFKLVFAKKCS